MTMKKLIGALFVFALPILVLGQGPQLDNVETFFESISRIINLLLPVVIALALLFFFWGLAKFILAAGDEVDKEKGRNMMIWGIVALFVMVSVWGLIEFVGSALGIDAQGAPDGIENLSPIE
jgi:hypothetical protein